MRTIHKFPLAIGFNEVFTQPGAKFLSAHAQNGVPTLWYSVPNDANEKTEGHLVHVIGTGQDASAAPPSKFVGTCFCDPFVWHVFAD